MNRRTDQSAVRVGGALRPLLPLPFSPLPPGAAAEEIPIQGTLCSVLTPTEKTASACQSVTCGSLLARGQHVSPPQTPLSEGCTGPRPRAPRRRPGAPQWWDRYLCMQPCPGRRRKRRDRYCLCFTGPRAQCGVARAKGELTKAFCSPKHWQFLLVAQKGQYGREHLVRTSYVPGTAKHCIHIIPFRSINSTWEALRYLFQSMWSKQ